MRMQQTTEIVARGEDGEEFRLRYSNRGEPYREGCDVEVMLATDQYSPSVSIFLEHYELVRLRDALNKLLGQNEIALAPMPATPKA
jgi:hypothetical protein